MRYTKSVNTQTMLSEAISSNEGYFEVSRGEETVGVFFSGLTGHIIWESRGRATTEAGVAEVLARWAVEGITA